MFGFVKFFVDFEEENFTLLVLRIYYCFFFIVVRYIFGKGGVKGDESDIRFLIYFVFLFFLFEIWLICLSFFYFYEGV